MHSSTVTQRPTLTQIILVLGSFLIIAYLSTSQFQLPIQLVLLTGWFLVLGLGFFLGYDYPSLESAAMSGIHKGSQSVFILMSVGLLVGTWIVAGIVPSIIYYGLKLIHPSVFLLTALIICSATSLGTGTSWGAAATAGIAMMGIGQSLGIPAPIVAGAVLSGVYFGDKLSPLSDSVVLASSMSEVNIVDHIKGMLPIGLTAYLITALLFGIVGLSYSGQADLSQVQRVIACIEEHYTISPISFVPIIAVLFLLSRGLSAFPVITFGAFLGVLWAIVFQQTSWVDAIMAAYQPKAVDTGIDFVNRLLNQGGMLAMLESIVVILLGLGLGGLIEKIGILDVLTQRLAHWATRTSRMTNSTLIVAFLVNMFGSAMYVALILTPKVMIKHYDRLKMPRTQLSRNAEFGGTLTSGMIPWSDNGLFMASVLGVATLDYLPYMWLSFICLLITIASGYMKGAKNGNIR